MLYLPEDLGSAMMKSSAGPPGLDPSTNPWILQEPLTLVGSPMDTAYFAEFLSPQPPKLHCFLLTTFPYQETYLFLHLHIFQFTNKSPQPLVVNLMHKVCL